MQVSAEQLPCEVKWIGRADCRHCKDRKNTLFGVLSHKELEELPAQIDQLEFPPNYRIYSAGDEKDNVFTIREGFVKAIAQTADGSERIVRLYKSGDLIGLEAILDSGYRHTLVTMGTVRLCRIPAKVIKRLINRSTRLSEQLMRQWQAGVERADYWLTRLTSGSIESRVVWLLRLLVKFNGEEEFPEIRLPANTEMAAIVDATVESVSRAMAKLKRAEVLRRVQPHTYRCDTGKLSL